MFESAISDGTNEFRLEEEVFESRDVDTGVAALGGNGASGGGLLLLAVTSGSGGLVGWQLLVRVVDEVFLVETHDGDLWL
jgi:hypothetical protein